MLVTMRMPAFGCLAAAAFLAASMLTSETAHAQTQQQIERCINAGNLFSREMQISGCTAVIQSGRGQEKNLLWAFHSRAYAYYKNDNYQAAIADFDELIRIRPDDAHALNGRCWMRAIIGRELRQALEDCNESLRLRANDPMTLDSRGFTCLKLGQFNNAISDYEAALGIDPKQAESLFGRGIAKLKKGDRQGGNADIAAAKAIRADVAEEFAKYGIRLEDAIASILPSPQAADCARAVSVKRSLIKSASGL